ncbi:MAG: hypothetical protein OXG60_13350 [Chloroflexi bacterium]|nr:hypothetical protein [Chloroflexota bacterium]
MFTRDIQIERLKAEYESLRQTQDKILEGMNLTALMLIRMEESVNANREATNKNSQALQAIMEYFKIPPKPGTGFNPEQKE